mgnify:CR=1 FL=1
MKWFFYGYYLVFLQLKNYNHRDLGGEQLDY